eukprot:gene12932-3689_t
MEVNDCKEQSFLKILSDGKSYYLITQCPKQGDACLSLTALDELQVWSGQVNHESLKDQAVSAEKSLSDFLSETKSAFALNSTKRIEEFSLGIEIEDNTAVISWKKVLDQDLKFKLGTAKLQRDNGINASEFLDVAVGQFMKMKDEIIDLSSTKEKLLREREKTLKRLEGFVHAKNEIEKSLYEKFALVLNAKKAKIRELKEKCRGNTTTSKRSASDNFDETTDEEQEKDEVTKTLKEDKLPALFDDIDIEEAAPPPAKRKTRGRHQRDNKPARVPRKISLPRAVTKESLNLERRSSRQSSNLESSSDDFDKLVNMM